MPRDRGPSGTINPDSPSIEAVLAVHELRIKTLEGKLDTIIKLAVSAVISGAAAAASSIAHILMHTKGL